MKKMICAALAVFALSACHNEPRFCVEGEVSGAG